jgi:hypothetical protein
MCFTQIATPTLTGGGFYLYNNIQIFYKIVAILFAYVKNA